MTRRFVVILGLAIWITQNTGCQSVNERVRPVAQPQNDDPYENHRQARLVIRKLHLVRPDLIFTPLDWAVYC